MRNWIWAISALLVFSCVRTDPNSVDPEAKQTSLASSPNTITFAGISGVPPRFIDSGPMKGMGTLEFATRPIRKGMVQSGFEIQFEYFTPARIAHEFRSKRPICFYPTEWTHPESLFETKPDRIYSIPLDLGGETTSSIIIRKQDFALFKPFMDSKGDVAVLDLLKAHHLKTQLVRDKDYGPLTSLVSFTSPSGDQEVRNEYRKNVEIRLISDNRQIIEMLNAKRFDYAFYDDIEVEDFKKTKIDPDRFTLLSFQTGRVKDENDPNLVRLSISCSDTPITRKAMPHFNHWISLARGAPAMNRSQKYRTSLDPKSVNTFSTLNSTPQRFRGIFQSGKLDDWYPLQQKHFPGLERFPPPAQETTGEASHTKQVAHSNPSQHESKWVALETGKSLLVVNQTGVRTGFEDQFDTSWYGLPNLDNATPQVYGDGDLLKNLPPEQSVILTSRPDLFAKGTSPSLTSLKLSGWAHIRSLTVFGSALRPEDVLSLKSYLEHQPLERLNLLSLSAQAAQILVPSIPRTVTHLNLAHSSLSDAELSKKLLRLQLKSLDLTYSQLTAEQLQTLLPSLQNIEELTLKYLRTIWSPETAKSFAQLKWQRLRKLDLENTALTHQALLTLIPALPPTLEALNLRANGLSQESLFRLFSKPFPKLHSLDLSLNFLGSTPDRAFQFPTEVRSLKLLNCGLNDERFSQITFPKQLETLDLSYNPISDPSYKRVEEITSRQMKHLNLSYTRPTDRGITSLFKSLQGRSIEELNLDHIKVTDSQLHLLCSDQDALRIKDLRSLNLEYNQVTSEGIRDLAKFYLGDLERIRLSVNPINKSGIAILATAVGPRLRALYLEDLPDLSIAELAPHLPPSLVSLGLGENQISDQEMEHLVPHLPRNLRLLGLSHSSFSERGAKLLAGHLPPLLETLDLQGSPSTHAILNQLPPNLKDVRIDLGLLKDGHFPQLPEGLLTLWGERTSVDSTTLGHFVAQLPRSLEKLRIYSKATVSYESPEPILWPPSLRELYTEGILFRPEFTKAAFTHLPSTLERFSVFAAGLDDQVLQYLASKGMKQLHTLQVPRNHFSSSGINQFLLYTPRLFFLILIGNEFPKTGIDAHSWTAPALQGIRFLQISQTPLNGPEAIDLVQKLPQHMILIEFASTLIEHEYFQRLLNSVPKGVRTLLVSSDALGGRGHDMLLRFKRKREADEGAFLDLGE